jgi:predicted dehydrogenase
VKPVRFGLIGCGRVARYHAQALTEIEGSELVTVCDIVPRRSTWKEDGGVLMNQCIHGIDLLRRKIAKHAIPRKAAHTHGQSGVH